MDFLRKLIFGTEQQQHSQQNEPYYPAIKKLQENHMRISRTRNIRHHTNIEALEMPMILEEKESNYQSDYHSTGKKMMTGGSFITRQDQLIRNISLTGPPIMKSQQEIMPRMAVSKPYTSPPSLTHSRSAPQTVQTVEAFQMYGSTANTMNISTPIRVPQTIPVAIPTPPLPPPAVATPFNIDYSQYNRTSQPQPGCCPCQQPQYPTPYGYHW